MSITYFTTNVHRLEQYLILFTGLCCMYSRNVYTGRNAMAQTLHALEMSITLIIRASCLLLWKPMEAYGSSN